MTKSKFARTRRANSFLVHHSQFNALVDTINECIEDTENLAEPECLTIDGESGVGKSTVVQYFLKSMPTYREQKHQRIPAICLPVPVGVTHSRFASAILDVLGDPRSAAGTQSTKTKRIVHYLRNITKTKVVFFDEFHHLYNSETQKVLKQSSEWTKLLIRESGCTFVTIGIKDRVNAIFNSNEQLRRHFTSFTLEPFKFTPKDPDSIFTFISVIKSIEDGVGVQIAPELNEREKAARIYKATNGKIGYIMSLIRKSVYTADKANLPNVPLSVLENVYDKRLAHKINVEKNPFKLDNKIQVK